MTATSTRFAKLKFIALAALFAAPVLLAVLLHSLGWRPQGSVNHGELVQPARAIRPVVLQRLDGASMEFPSGQKKWTMLYFGSAHCDGACRESLYKMRQVHLAQGKDAGRMQRVFIATDAREARGLNALLADYPDTQILIGGAAEMRALAGQFRMTGPSEVPGRIYMLDPLGNWMMSYPPGADPTGIRKDIVRLLKVSKIG